MTRFTARNLILTGGIQHDFQRAANALARCLNDAIVVSTISEELDASWQKIADGEFELVEVRLEDLPRMYNHL